MEKIVEMMSAIGILLTPIIMLVAFFYVFWYGSLLFDWILESLFGVTDWIAMAMVGGFNDNSQYDDTFYYNTDRLNQDRNKNDDYYSEYFHQDYSQIVLSKNDYQILGVRQNANLEEIKKTWRKLCKKYHPDYNPGDKSAEERMKQINGAYERLTKRQNMEVR